MRIVPSALLVCSLFLPGIALARTVVVAPLLGADPKATSNVTDLIASELDFMGEIDDVVQLPKAPANLNLACLSSASCLGGIARANGGDQIVAGQLTLAGTNFNLDLVLFDVATGKQVRRKQFTLPNSPEQIADGMNPLVKELMGGSAPAPATTAKAAAAPTTKSGEDDFAFEPDAPHPSSSSHPTTTHAAAAKPPVDDELDIDDITLDEPSPEDEHAAAQAAQQAQIDAARKADADAKAKAAEQARLAEQARQAEEERRRQEELARQKAAEEARQKAAAEAAARAAAEEQARAATAAAAKAKADQEARDRAAAKARADQQAAAASASDDDFDPSSISFGSSTDQMVVEDVEAEIQFAPSSATSTTTTAPAHTDAPAPTRSYYEEDVDPDAQAELDAQDHEAMVDLDDDSTGTRTPPSRSAPSSSRQSAAPARSTPSSSRTQIDHPKSESDGPKTVQITLRGGYSRYYAFNFLTGGGEVALGVARNVYLLGGAEVYAVQRRIPPELQLVPGRVTEWNTIYPINAGIAWKGGQHSVHPYVGADAIMTTYYFDENRKASWAIGARARAGADFMVADNFGFNLNASVGMWHGKNWGIVEQGVKATGALPQISAGTVIAF